MELHPKNQQRSIDPNSATIYHHCQPSCTQLLLNGKSTTKQPRPKVDRVKHSQTMGLTKLFSLEELNTSINTLKTGKAIGLDNIFTEEIKHFGPLMRKWTSS
ncbi:hypothetical protein AAFF_G00055380 [Aldrovandia affinis]|uniref:Uncharacterized protein n=1 Tax=Aldrovandia affinis TaxID=143900 RepID=A0AAD7VY69_9TELE|nr:hypothetical protein AAFF_G00055380 [Aldrovandia affinis]